MQIHEAVTELERHRGRTDIRLDELVDIANHLIRLVVPAQPSDRVAETLNERTLRFYIAEGLIDRPLGKEGTAALYGYRHLLQALIVKALQGAYLPIKRIREILRGKTDRELEAILSCQDLEMSGAAPGVEPFKAMLADSQSLEVHLARQKALSFLDDLLSASEPRLPQGETTASAPLYRPQAESFRRSVGQDGSPVSRTGEVPDLSSWERFSLEDGIELHVRADRLKGLRRSEIKRAVERLLTLLRSKKQPD